MRSHLYGGRSGCKGGMAVVMLVRRRLGRLVRRLGRVVAWKRGGLGLGLELELSLAYARQRAVFVLLVDF